MKFDQSSTLLSTSMLDHSESTFSSQLYTFMQDHGLGCDQVYSVAEASLGPVGRGVCILSSGPEGALTPTILILVEHCLLRTDVSGIISHQLGIYEGSAPRFLAALPLDVSLRVPRPDVRTSKFKLTSPLFRVVCAVLAPPRLVRCAPYLLRAFAQPDYPAQS
ncbi:hypothetical protein FA95DRAFT_1027388 [Auriscalpium vulgare]|uniref:Uncharacterized protein n=1 Tax=Auriscalpium vulgare TaxID=40419 RepID=A0ACB8R709_9AGAM|nr:hypothetical protein FA95DRAFT_1027388 [Auriscalpium vulgare]